jgi:hypothetical protein
MPVRNDGHPGSQHRSTARAGSPRADRLTRSERTPTASGALAADSKAAEGQSRTRHAAAGATGDDGTARAHVTRALAAVLDTLSAQIKALAAQITEQLGLHADAHVFTSLPRSLPRSRDRSRDRPRRPAARRDRRLPRLLPRPAIADVPGRGGALHPPVRQGQGRQLPLSRRQAAARPPSATSPSAPATPVPGPPSFTTTPSLVVKIIPAPPVRRPRLAVWDLALPAGAHRLRPRSPQSPPAAAERG